MRMNTGTFTSERATLSRVSPMPRRAARIRQRGTSSRAGTLPKSASRHGAHFVGRHIARDHQDRVVGRIVVHVEILRFDAADAANLIRPADHRAAIGMGKIQRGVDLFAHQRLRIVVDAHAALFQHHVALGAHVVIGKIEIGHAVGFEPP